MRRTRLIKFLLVFTLTPGSVLATGLSGVTGSAVASTASAPVAAARGAPRIPAAPVSEICDVRGSSSLCANRSGGGTGLGTSVIAWSAGDSNNDFGYSWLNAMCGNGYVTTTCPFSTRGNLNSRYLGAPIAAIFTLTGPGCIAASNPYSGYTALGACPDPAGNNGADGTIFVLAQVTNRNDPATTYAVNRYWSNDVLGGNGTAPRWLCVAGKGQFLTENSASGSAGICQWNELHH